MLTVTRNSGGLENLEAIGSVKGGDLSVGELGEELGLFVVLEVDVALREVKLDSGKGSNRANLCFAELITRNVSRTSRYLRACQSPAQEWCRGCQWTPFLRGREKDGRW